MGSLSILRHLGSGQLSSVKWNESIPTNVTAIYPLTRPLNSPGLDRHNIYLWLCILFGRHLTLSSAISNAHTTVLEPSGIPVTGTPSISLISNFINRWRTCYLFNNIDGVPVTGIPDGSRTVLVTFCKSSAVFMELINLPGRSKIFCVGNITTLSILDILIDILTNISIIFK